MKTLKTVKTLVSLVLVLGLSACGQQLVEFGTHDMTAAIDFARPLDFAVDRFDLSSSLSDLSASSDLSSTSDGSDGPPRELIDAAPEEPLAACAAMLGPAAQSFAVLGGSTVTNTGPSSIANGNIGVSPGNSITGIPPGMPVGGSIHLADALAAKAQMDVTNIYTCTQAAACSQMLTGTDLGGLTLGPGVYCFTSSAALTGTLVLDAFGDPNAIWFFEIMSTLDLADNAHVYVIGGGKDCNVFWQVGSSVTVGKTARLAGNMLSMASVTLDTGASVSGRALARSGAVTMDSNDVVVPSCQ